MELLHTAALLLLQRCARTVATATMASVVQQESSWSPYAIADGTAKRQYYPATYANAVAIADALLARHHRIAVGYAGVLSTNFAAYRVGVQTALDPCVNLAIGADILNYFYFGPLHPYRVTDQYSEACRDTAQRGSDGELLCRSGGALDRYGRQYALSASLQAYNTGSYVGSPKYAYDVITRAQQIVIALPPPPDISLQQSAAPPATPPSAVTKQAHKVTQRTSRRARP